LCGPDAAESPSDRMTLLRILLLFLVPCAWMAKGANADDRQRRSDREVHKAMNAAELDQWAQAKGLQAATFGTGCFWCTEACFRELNGVEKVISGYSGGHVENPTYEQVCSKTTGHVEVVRIFYDPEQVTYDKLLEVFWKIHDPTSWDRQGADAGPQYRSAIFYHDEHQRERAEYYKQKLDEAKVYDRKIVTVIEPLKNFYPAEEYHQNYLELNPRNPYCQAVVLPKVAKFKQVFAQDLKPQVAK
jgi:peptide-methionine (S)-S-oxide reductase